jgi:hypothetical protein
LDRKFEKMSATSLKGVFSMGAHTPLVRMALHAANRKRLLERLQKVSAAAAGMVLLQGGKHTETMRHATDASGEIFRQESYFHWAFGGQSLFSIIH